MKRRKMYFRMITASLMRRRSRMLVALLAIAIGATILSGLVTIYYDVPRQMGAQFRNYGANMILTASDEKFTAADMESAVGYIEKNALVGAAPFKYESVQIHERPIMAAGTNLAQVQITSPYWQVSGEWPESTGQILVGTQVAETFRLKVGDTVAAAIGENEMDFEVTGILDTGGSEEEYVYMNLEDLEALSGVSDHLDVAEVSVSASAQELSDYVETINEKVPSVSAKLVKRLAQSETTVLGKLEALVLLVTVVVLALTMICVATTMTAVVTERRKEIGLRKALGASNTSIITEFMGEGLMLGGIGGIIGSVLGFLFAQFVSVNVFNSSISLLPALIPITVIVSIVVTGLACLFPVRSATDVDPALVLKGE